MRVMPSKKICNRGKKQVILFPVVATKNICTYNLSMKNTGTCAHCKCTFTQTIGRGKAKKYCSEDCQSAAAMARPKVFGTCKVDGCSNTANRKGANLCEMHYTRMRRNGALELMPLKDAYVHSHGYIVERDKHHPLSTNGITVYQHRRVFYNEHGAGPFTCHWCNSPVDWSFMHVDHVDANKQNNDVSNLVASCPTCNQSRGLEDMKRTVRKRVGVAFNGQIKTLNEWAKTIGISGVSLKHRLKEGWTLERALTTPRGKFGPKPKS